MNEHTTHPAHGPHKNRRVSPAGIVVRSLLGVSVCVLAWLCVRTSLAIERLDRIFHGMFGDAPPPELSNFAWHHPLLLLGFTVAIALAALLCLTFSKLQRRAEIVGGVVITVLLVQWLIVAPAVGGTTIQVMQKLARETSK